ncbi:hypothetical protein RUM44_009936 [Polyplax serrata]|uniref:Uncharacterized protein n=1 Tax=Polyplax serrata TaxID=468196 RepID=A0ABR1AU47_POLSC
MHCKHYRSADGGDFKRTQKDLDHCQSGCVGRSFNHSLEISKKTLEFGSSASPQKKGEKFLEVSYYEDVIDCLETLYKCSANLEILGNAIFCPFDPINSNQLKISNALQRTYQEIN